LYIQREKVLTLQIKSIQVFILECESNIEVVETKIKEELATKKVVEAQKLAFKASQKLVDSEEELNGAKVTGEEEKSELNEQSKKCKKQFDKDTADLKAL